VHPMDVTNLCRALPTVTFDEVFHVGTLNADDKRSQYSTSLEGDGLSVSLHPDEWIQIARLGGNPTWRATRDGNRFVDRWEITDEQRHAIEAWAVAVGLVETVTRFELTRYDCELEDDYITHLCTFDEADSERDGDDDATITEIQTLAVRPALASLAAATAGDTLGAFDAALGVFVQTHTDADGVWWFDTYNPDALSAPRGVIFADRVEHWSFTQREFDSKRP
jgi:hypothetical protein